MFLLIIVDISAILSPLIYILAAYLTKPQMLSETHTIIILCVWIAITVLGSIIWTIFILRQIKNMKNNDVNDREV